MTVRVTLLLSTEPDRAAAPPGCQGAVQGTAFRGEGRENIIPPTAASCRSRRAASRSRRNSPANPAAVGGSSWIAKKPCDVHAKGGAVLITNQSSGAAVGSVCLQKAESWLKEVISREKKKKKIAWAL